MISPNVLKVTGEILADHHIHPRQGEYMGDMVARGLGMTAGQAEIWLDALNEGCTLEEANDRAELPVERAEEPVLNAVARSIGSLLGKLSG